MGLAFGPPTKGKDRRIVQEKDCLGDRAVKRRHIPQSIDKLIRSFGPSDRSAELWGSPMDPPPKEKIEELHTKRIETDIAKEKLHKKRIEPHIVQGKD